MASSESSNEVPTSDFLKKSSSNSEKLNCESELREENSNCEMSQEMETEEIVLPPNNQT